jgi:uncharacterized protein YcbX
MSQSSKVGFVASLHRYPVKSMMGEELDSTRVGSKGIQGDRVFALADPQTGKIASAKNPSKWPNLFQFSAAFTFPLQAAGPLPPAQITLPDGSSVYTDSESVESLLSSGLGKPIRFLASPPQNGTLEEYWPNVEGLARNDVVTDEAMPADTFFDVGLIHVLTTATLGSLGARYPQGKFETRRFRPILVIKTEPPTGEFPEREWTEKILSIGNEVKIKITGPCGRCVMTTLQQGNLPRDVGILKTAAQHNQAQVGAYASVVQGGTVRKGDPVLLSLS